MGGGAIGSALVPLLRQRAPSLQVHLAGRRQPDWPLDLCDDTSLSLFAERARVALNPLRLVICTAGILHGENLAPEKRLAQVSRQALERSFALNAYGPLLLAKAVEAAIPRELPAHFASLSARVGSIGDNRLGGWYSYRAAKAAQNQLLKTLSLEWRRRLPQVCVTLLHPGTTASALSEPFRTSVAPEQLFSPERAATQLLDVLEPREASDSGAFLAWDGSLVPW